MAEENKIIPYFFGFTFKAGGIVNSDLSADEVRARLAEDLTEVYGEDGFEITEVRPATEEELSAVEAFFSEEGEVDKETTLH